MTRAARITSTVALALISLGCRPSPSVEATAPAAPPTRARAEATPVTPALEVHEIALPGDGRSYPIALAELDEGAVVFVTEPTGIGRYAINFDAGTATASASLALDRYPHVAAYERGHDRLWWIAAEQQLRLHRASGGDFPRGDLVLTITSALARSDGLHAIIRVCPPPTGILGGAGSSCDHQLRVLAPAFDGVVVAGHLAERVGQTSPQAWIGFADPSGTLTAAHPLTDSYDARVDALAVSDASVLAVVWSGSGEPARSSFLLFRGPTLELRHTAPRTTPSWISTPWAAAVPAPDGGFWVALTTARHELTIVTIAADGSIAAERTIEGAELPIGSTQALGLRSGEPWLMIADANPRPTLWVTRVDPATGEALERHEIALPDGLTPERMLAVDRGFVLAGRVGLERPLVVWIPTQSGSTVIAS